MKKGIIALSVAALLASIASAASAQVTVNSRTGRPNVPFVQSGEVQADKAADKKAHKKAAKKAHKKAHKKAPKAAH